MITNKYLFIAIVSVILVGIFLVNLPESKTPVVYDIDSNSQQGLSTTSLSSPIEIVTPVEEPLVPTIPPTATNTSSKPTKPPATTTPKNCFVGGCSSHVCSSHPDIMTTCEWREEYACYREATCEVQPSGECGWTENPALIQCLNSKGEAVM